MMEQVQHISDGTALFGGKGKAGKGDAFTNLFKALSLKADAADLKAAAAGLQAGGKGKNAAAMLHATAGKTAGITGKHDAKLIKPDATVGTAKDDKHIAGKARHDRQTPELDAQAAALAAAAQQPAHPSTQANTAKVHIATMHDAEQAADKDGKIAAGKATGGSIKDHVAARIAVRGNPNGADAGDEQAVAVRKDTAAPVAARHAASDARVPAAAKAAARSTPATPLAANSNQPSADTQDEAFNTVLQARTRPVSAHQQAAPLAARQHAAQGQNRTQAGALDQDSLQHDVDTMQQIRNELDAMAHKAVQKTTRPEDNARGSAEHRGDQSSTGRHAAAGLNAQGHIQGQQSSVQTAIANAQANHDIAAQASDHRQPGSGHEGSQQRDGIDTAMLNTQRSDARPHSFDLQQQAATAARMAQPMRPLEAIQNIAHSAANGTTKLELQLEPAHLGKVHVSLQTDAAKHLQMHLTVEHPMAREVIEQHMPQLRAALEQQGLNLDNFSLNTGSHGSQGQQQHQQQTHDYMAGNFAARGSQGSAMPVGATAQGSSQSGSGISIHI